MSAQSELDQRIEEVNQLLEDMETLLPSLMAHGLHIISMDPSLFKEQINTCRSRLSQLKSEDQELGNRILSWFENNYPRKEVNALPGIPQRRVIARRILKGRKTERTFRRYYAQRRRKHTWKWAGKSIIFVKWRKSSKHRWVFFR